jgi:hypothetical protein
MRRGDIMIRTFTLLLLATLALASAATAAKPVVTDIDVPLSSLGIDPVVSSLCGFDVEVFQEGQVRITEFSDGTTQLSSHKRFYWTANGKSLTEHANFTITFAADESTTFQGTVFNLVVPGAGPVLKEAGLVVFDRDGNIVRMSGLHQVLEGTDNLPALCDYFSA